MLITTQAQPPPFLTTSTGAVIKVKEKETGHKWLGCMLSAAGSKNAILDIDYHLQSASRAFFANKWIFLSRNVSIRNKLKFFNAIVTPIACFGAGPRCIHNADMAKLDINFRRMIRSVVGAPNQICRGDPWHEILHIWNQRVREVVGAFISFQSLASVTHGHGTQALYWRCAKQKDRAKIFHCFKLENKASSRSAPPTTSVASLYTLDPQEFFGRPRRCGCSAIRGRRV